MFFGANLVQKCKLLTVATIWCFFASANLWDSQAWAADNVQSTQTSSTDIFGPADVFGKWLTEDASIINIQPCDEGVCGVLEWFAELEGAEVAILDSQNEDEVLRSRELKGIKFIYGFVETKKGWRKGKIYDPASGKTYKSKLTRLDAKTLKVQGCVGPVCKKFIWAVAPQQ